MTERNQPDLFGVVANVLQPDRILRTGTRVWIADGTGGEGWYRFQWLGLSRGGRRLIKWAPIERFHKFRAAWIPEDLRDRITYITGSRKAMEQTALDLELFAMEQRSKHTKGGPGKPEPPN